MSFKMPMHPKTSVAKSGKPDGKSNADDSGQSGRSMCMACDNFLPQNKMKDHLRVEHRELTFELSLAPDAHTDIVSEWAKALLHEVPEPKRRARSLATAANKKERRAAKVDLNGTLPARLGLSYNSVASTEQPEQNPPAKKPRASRKRAKAAPDLNQTWEEVGSKRRGICQPPLEIGFSATNSTAPVNADGCSESRQSGNGRGASKNRKAANVDLNATWSVLGLKRDGKGSTDSVVDSSIPDNLKKAKTLKDVLSGSQFTPECLLLLSARVKRLHSAKDANDADSEQLLMCKMCDEKVAGTATRDHAIEAHLGAHDVYKCSECEFGTHVKADAQEHINHAHPSAVMVTKLSEYASNIEKLMGQCFMPIFEDDPITNKAAEAVITVEPIVDAVEVGTLHLSLSSPPLNTTCGESSASTECDRGNEPETERVNCFTIATEEKKSGDRGETSTPVQSNVPSAPPVPEPNSVDTGPNQSPTARPRPMLRPLARSSSPDVALRSNSSSAPCVKGPVVKVVSTMKRPVRDLSQPEDKICTCHLCNKAFCLQRLQLHVYNKHSDGFDKRAPDFRDTFSITYDKCFPFVKLATRS